MLESLQEFFSALTDSEKIIHIGGLSLLLVIIFAETGLMIGFFLPGDYLLFTAGLLCGTQDLNISIFGLTALATGAAILGDYTGFFTGKYLGPRLFKREDSLFFNKKYLQKTEIVFKKYGASTLIIGRFLPIVRTFAPMIAGAAKMNQAKFATFNIVGGVIWCGTLIPLGFLFGREIPDAHEYIGYIVLITVVITTAVVISGIIKARREFKNTITANTPSLK